MTLFWCFREEFDFMEDPEDDRPRFELYVKKSSTNGGPRGSCPFSLKAFMFMNLTVDGKDFKAHSVDIINKPFYMMKLNPGQSVGIVRICVEPCSHVTRFSPKFPLIFSPNFFGLNG